MLWAVNMNWSNISGVFLWFALLVVVQSLHSWRTDRKPKIYGDKLSRKMLLPNYKRLQKKIVTYHNGFRSNVAPPAADMLRMTWHKGAARAAQYWAERCMLLTHDDARGRYVEEFGSCGQNIFVSTQQVPWYFAIQTWFLERMNFTYGSNQNDLDVVGHYTQMVWASSHRVGCGFAKCYGGTQRQFYNYVCNYCPIGNYREKLGRPYKKGKSCSKCPGHCRQKKLCTNSCPAADQWANCRELNATWHQWLCNDHSNEGRERLKHCKATCNCRDKIY